MKTKLPRGTLGTATLKGLLASWSQLFADAAQCAKMEGAVAALNNVTLPKLHHAIGKRILKSSNLPADLISHRNRIEELEAVIAAKPNDQEVGSASGFHLRVKQAAQRAVNRAVMTAGSATSMAKLQAAYVAFGKQAIERYGSKALPKDLREQYEAAIQKQTDLATQITAMKSSPGLFGLTPHRLGFLTLIAIVCVLVTAAIAIARRANEQPAGSLASRNVSAESSPWKIESETGLNNYDRVIDNAIATCLGDVSQAFTERSFRGVKLGEKYVPVESAVDAGPWLLPSDEKLQINEVHKADVRVIVDADSKRVVGIFARYKQPLGGMIDEIRSMFGRTSQEIDSREVLGFGFDANLIKYTFPDTIVRVYGHRFETRIIVLDRDYVEASLRPFANAVLSACQWLKQVLRYGREDAAEPVQNLPFAGLQCVRNSDEWLLLLYDKDSQKIARQQAEGDSRKCRWDVAAAWIRGNTRAGVVTLLTCPSIGVPTLLLSEKHYVDRNLATAGLILDLFHDVGNALVQTEFPPAGESITVRNPRCSWDGDCSAFPSPQLQENDKDIFERANCLDQEGMPIHLRRAYEWKDGDGWLITLTEELSLRVVRQ